MYFGKKQKNYSLKTFIKHNWAYFACYIFTLIMAAYFLLQYDKVSIHVAINSIVGNPFIDLFFKYITHMGDGIIAIIIAVIVLFLNAKKGLFVLVTYFASGITTTILKKYIYNVDRPHSVFSFYLPTTKLKFVEGVEMFGFNSFPSGHATTAFAVFTSLALITNNSRLKFIFFLLAFFTAFSRTYLSQHWLVDITMGSIIGTLYALVFYFIIIHFNNFQKLNKPLLKIFKPE